MEPVSLQENQYTPLKTASSLQYLRLLPGEGAIHSNTEYADPIHCDIFEATVEDAVSYTALSYVWGTDDASKTISCNGSSYLTIRPNLYNALCRIRDFREARILWVDAICIDQSNVSERNHQVAQMTQIYSNAGKLSVSLGLDDGKKTVLTIMLVKRLAAKEKNGGTSTELVPGVVTTHASKRLLLKFLETIWLKRTWVIQERVLGLEMEGDSATEILVGPYTLLWSELYRCCETVKERVYDLYTNFDLSDVEAIKIAADRILFVHRFIAVNY